MVQNIDAVRLIQERWRKRIGVSSAAVRTHRTVAGTTVIRNTSNTSHPVALAKSTSGAHDLSSASNGDTITFSNPMLMHSQANQGGKKTAIGNAPLSH